MSDYTKTEEAINIYSHGIGFLLSLIALGFLIYKSIGQSSYIIGFSFVVFGLSLCMLYLASTVYHNSKEPHKRFKRKVLDHCSIYVLIAGTYTPYTLAALGESVGVIIFIVSWSFAIIGIILKLLFTGRFKMISTLMYVFMGWMIVFFISPLKLALLDGGFDWLLIGGVFYTVGAIIYSLKKIEYNHAIFHVFVLAGSISHFISIYFYIN